MVKEIFKHPVSTGPRIFIVFWKYFYNTGNRIKGANSSRLLNPYGNTLTDEIF